MADRCRHRSSVDMAGGSHWRLPIAWAALLLVARAHRLAARPRHAAARPAWRFRARPSLALAAATVASRGAGAEEPRADPTLVAEFDADGDGRVSREEYESALQRTAAAHSGGAAGTREAWLDAHRRLFDIGDIDADGLLGERELRYMHHLTLDMDAEESARDFGAEAAASLLAEADKNGDGFVDGDEYADFSSRWDGVEALQEIFDVADVDGDGRLGKRELQFCSLIAEDELGGSGGEVVHPGRQSEAYFSVGDGDKLASHMLQELDKNGDGMIDEEEIAIGLAAEAEIVHEWSEAGEEPAKSIISRIGAKFQEADADADGRLDKDEAERLATRVLVEMHDEFFAEF